MIPLLPFAIGALVGSAVTYIARRDEEKKVNATLQATIDELKNAEVRATAARDREVQQRCELLRLTLECSKERLNSLYQSGAAPLAQMERVYSVGMAMQMIIEKRPSDGVLAPRDRVFVDCVRKFQLGEPLTKVERAQIEEYLDEHIGDIRRNFLEDQLARAYQRETSRLADMEKDLADAEFKLDALKRRELVEGRVDPLMTALPATIERLKRQIAEARARIAQNERALVVLARVSRDEDVQEEQDRGALRIIQYVARGDLLTPEEAQFLDDYRVFYFASTREIILKRHGLDILRRETVAA